MITLYPFQEDIVTRLRLAFRKHLSVLLVSPTGSGKCLGHGTPVLMFNGTIKEVQNVAVGDWLMGPDSRPREVLSLARGREEMFRVTPIKGDSYVVNKSHILSLKRTYEGKGGNLGGTTINISVDDYLKSTNSFKHIHKGWRTGVSFTPPASEPPVPPYILGMWLGDGHTNHATITSADTEVIKEWSEYVDSHGMIARIETQKNNASVVIHAVTKIGFGLNGGVKGGNPIRKKLQRLGVIGNKHIPHRYLTGTRQERLDLLAGLMDTDGSLARCGFDFISIHRSLSEDVVFLARSVGLAAYMNPVKKYCVNNGVLGSYYRVSISGFTNCIPCRIARKKASARRQKKDVLVTGIKVESIGVGDYYGFQIDGDGLFMLGDFTVTHNTVMFSHLASAIASKSQRIIIMVHREELLQQVSDTLTEFGVPHGLIAAGIPYDRRHFVHVASVFTLVRRLDVVQIPDWCIIDESHHAINGNTWSTVLTHWRQHKPKMRLLGVTATPIRLSGQGLGISADGPFEHMVIGPSVCKLIELGKLSPYRLIVPPSLIDRTKLHKRAGDFIAGEVDSAMSKPAVIGSVLSHYRKFCDGLQTVLFAPSVHMAEMYASEFRSAGYRSMSIDGRMDKDIRRAAVGDFKRGALTLLMSAQLIDEGFDCPNIVAMLDTSPTESLSRCMQRWGRTLRTAPGKDKAIIVDCVGNSGTIDDGEFIAKHGMPDDDREWTLDGVAAKPSGEKLAPADKRCGSCLCMNKVYATICKDCKEPFVAKPRKVDQVDGELQEVDPGIAKRQARVEQGTAKGLDQLIELGRQRYGPIKGPRWARHIWDAREKKKQSLAEARLQ